ncbi:hypothetical protein ABTY98_40250 [Streptomyces sp. NPDC096040]
MPDARPAGTCPQPPHRSTETIMADIGQQLIEKDLAAVEARVLQ